MHGHIKVESVVAEVDPGGFEANAAAGLEEAWCEGLPFIPYVDFAGGLEEDEVVDLVAELRAQAEEVADAGGCRW